MSIEATKKEMASSGRSDGVVSTINSTDALDMVEHGSELTMTISTPIGRKYQCASRFLGTHPDNLVLVETPHLPKDEFEFFFQTGFKLNVRAISPRGEGAKIHFQSQIQHIVQEPISMIAISVPNSMRVTQLRKEARYDINLMGAVLQDSGNTQCEIRDLSKSGCRFFTPPLGKSFQVGDEVTIGLHRTLEQPKCPPLIGTICNLQRSAHYSRYGLEFSEEGKANVKTLLSYLKFNGTKLAFSNKLKPKGNG
ncbi:flagellar brake protein [Vibrio amylolyticus]|uniref:flagellar brake protein n=1 Tax=Vibrio amylolyticus TaxID=2847292 RepID=UPI0035543F80